MTSVKLISDEEATGKVKEIFEDIKETLGIDFVPNLYRAMAHIPEYLEAHWNKTRATMQRPGKLDKLTREIIAVAVSAVNGCQYCIEVHTAAARKLGLDDEGITELMTIVDLFSGLNKFSEGLQLEMDEKPWYG
jgi:uncharacterized peroxidase-related enzyme